MGVEAGRLTDEDVGVVAASSVLGVDETDGAVVGIVESVTDDDDEAEEGTETCLRSAAG